MTTIHRYHKDTLKNQYWEMSITEKEDGTIELYSGHHKKDGGNPIKEKLVEITSKQAEKYKIKNAQYHIETYST